MAAGLPAVLTGTASPRVKSRTGMKKLDGAAFMSLAAPRHSMKTAPSILPGLISAEGALLIDSRLLEQIADLMHDTALFIKDAAGRYLVVNQSLVDRHGLADKAQMIGRRPCEICPGEY